MKSSIIASQNATVTIQIYGETGETYIIDDGMGGEEEVAEEDWYAILEGERIPARYAPRGIVLERTDRGDRIIESPAVGVHPRHIGTIEDGEYQFVDAELGTPGLDVRVDINSAAAPEGRTKVTKVTPEIGMGRMPIAIWFELEGVTE